MGFGDSHPEALGLKTCCDPTLVGRCHSGGHGPGGSVVPKPSLGYEVPTFRAAEFETMQGEPQLGQMVGFQQVGAVLTRARFRASKLGAARVAFPDSAAFPDVLNFHRIFG